MRCLRLLAQSQGTLQSSQCLQYFMCVHPVSSVLCCVLLVQVRVSVCECAVACVCVRCVSVMKSVTAILSEDLLLTVCFLLLPLPQKNSSSTIFAMSARSVAGLSCPRPYAPQFTYAQKGNSFTYISSTAGVALILEYQLVRRRKSRSKCRCCEMPKESIYT